MTATEQVLKNVDALKEWQEPLYLELHQNPELPMMETETLAEIVKRLKEYGYDVKEMGGGCVGVLENGDGPTVLFRADIDALPVAEEADVPYKSTKRALDQHGVEQPVMHACAHDMHITAGLGAAKLLADNKDQWSGTYLALFQPAEETAEGAQSMVDAGLVDMVPKPDVALGQHVLAAPVAGQVTITEAGGPVLSTATSCEVVVYGKGSHGSMPHLGVDPVVLGSAIVTRLQSIVARELPPGTFGVVTVGALVAGAKANIIPDSATLRINFRAYSEEVRDQLTAAMERIVKAECVAAGSPREPEFTYSDNYPLTNNDPEVSAKVKDAFVAEFGADNVVPMAPLTASEDFSNIPRAWDIPYCYWGVGGFTADMEAYPNHNPKFVPAMQPTLTMGTRAAVAGIMAYLGK